MEALKLEDVCTQIEVDNEHVFVLRDDGAPQKLEDGAVRRSKLLVQLLESIAGQARGSRDRCTLPVDPNALDTWRKYVELQLTKGSSDEERSTIEDLVTLVKVLSLSTLRQVT